MPSQITKEPWVPTTSLATRLLLLRHHLGLTMDAMAKRCGVPMATWATWEHGTRPRGLDAHVKRIAKATGVDRQWLMFGDNDAVGESPSRWMVPDGGIAA